MAGSRRVRVGISGWSYGSWRGDFYPRGLRQADELAYVAQHMDTAEVNASFYRLQRPTTYLRWYETTPRGFRFAVKGSRLLTHLLRLRDAEQAHGDRDLHTLTLRWCLGSMQAALGNVEIAVDELSRALTDTDAMFGADHPDTLAVREELRQLTAATEATASGRSTETGSWPPNPAVDPLTARYGAASTGRSTSTAACSACA